MKTKTFIRDVQELKKFIEFELKQKDYVNKIMEKASQR